MFRIVLRHFDTYVQFTSILAQVRSWKSDIFVSVLQVSAKTLGTTKERAVCFWIMVSVNLYFSKYALWNYCRIIRDFYIQNWVFSIKSNISISVNWTEICRFLEKENFDLFLRLKVQLILIQIISNTFSWNAPGAAVENSYFNGSISTPMMIF